MIFTLSPQPLPVYPTRQIRTDQGLVACVLRTSSKTRIMPKKGTSPAMITIGSKEWVPAAWRASEKWPLNLPALKGGDS